MLNFQHGDSRCSCLATMEQGTGRQSLLAQVPSFPDKMFENRIPVSSNLCLFPEAPQGKVLHHELGSGSGGRIGESAPCCHLYCSKELCSEASIQEE